MSLPGEILVVIDADMEDIVPGFLVNQKKEADKIEQALIAEDFEVVDRIAHNLKGLGAGYGFQGITDIGIKMREASQQKTELEILLAELRGYLNKVKISYE